MGKAKRTIAAAKQAIERDRTKGMPEADQGSLVDRYVRTHTPEHLDPPDPGQAPRPRRQ